MYKKNKRKIDKIEELICVLIIMSQNFEKQIQDLKNQNQKLKISIGEVKKIKETYV